MAVQVVDDLLHHVPFVGGFELIAAFRRGWSRRLFPVQKQDHLGDIGLQHEIASRLAALALRLDQGAETGEQHEGLFRGMKQKLPSGKSDLVALHVPKLDVGEGNVEFHQR